VDERKSENFDNLLESTRNLDEKHLFNVGDQVKLSDAQRNFSRSVPAHAGYTTEQFSWLDTLRKYEDETGEITRVSPSSEHVNVTFKDGYVIGIDASGLVSADGTGVTEAKAKKRKKDPEPDCSCGADIGVGEGISGRKHRKRMRKVREGEDVGKFVVMLGDTEEGLVTVEKDERTGYVLVNVEQFRKQEVPDSARLYLEDGSGYQYKRVMSPLPEEDMVLFKQM